MFSNSGKFFRRLRSMKFGISSRRGMHIQVLEEFAGLRRLIEEQVRRIDRLEHVVETVNARIDSMPHSLAILQDRANTAEQLMRLIDAQTRRVESIADITEQRSNTLEFVARLSMYEIDHSIQFLQKFYIEFKQAFPLVQETPAFNASKMMRIVTEFPIAVDSQDHLAPDSTTEGVVRPTMFVQDCIRVLGNDMKVLDIGCGAAGLVYEFAMNDVLSVGIDGSDFCRTNRVGYWPLLNNNLFTCDITKPFEFVSQVNKQPVRFDLVTSWEVLEHIGAEDLPALFENVRNLLHADAYFVGSISQVEYAAADGTPYHVTLESKAWWKAKFEESGLVMLDEHPLNEALFYRGNGPRFQDFHNYSAKPEDGFLFVAKVSPV